MKTYPVQAIKRLVSLMLREIAQLEIDYVTFGERGREIKNFTQLFVDPFLISPEVGIPKGHPGVQRQWWRLI
jgi:hypothetical protein